jgi:hypothetical protein
MTKTRAVLAGSALLALSGAAAGQASTTAATLSYSLFWEDTGNHNGVLEVGESAHLHLTVTMTPGVGTLIPFTGGQGGPTGTLRCIGTGFIDLTGAGGTQGTFNVDTFAGYGVDPTWDLVGPSGYGTPNGTGLMNIQFGQVPIGNPLLITTNPIINVWNSLWTPTSYSPRTVTFGIATGTAAGGHASQVIIKWGPQFGNLQYAYSLSDFGTLNIPILPAPATLALLGLGGVIAAARRRS